MDGEEKERLETLIAPFGREVRLDEVRFESGHEALARDDPRGQAHHPYSMSTRKPRSPGQKL